MSDEEDLNIEIEEVLGSPPVSSQHVRPRKVACVEPSDDARGWPRWDPVSMAGTAHLLNRLHPAG
jgi:hypothetical protein